VCVCIVCTLCYNSVQSVGIGKKLVVCDIRQKPFVLKSTLSKTLLTVIFLDALAPPLLQEKNEKDGVKSRPEIMIYHRDLTIRIDSH